MWWRHRIREQNGSSRQSADKTRVPEGPSQLHPRQSGARDWRPHPCVTSQGSGAKKTNKKVVRPGPRRLAAARVVRGERDRTDYSCLAYRIHSSSPTKRPTPGLGLPVLRSSPWAAILSDCEHSLNMNCISDFFTYETTKSVVVKSWTIGIINRAVQLLIISYFVG